VWILCDETLVRLNFGELADAPEPELLMTISTAQAWSISADARGTTKVDEIPLTLSPERLSGQLPEAAQVVIAALDYGVTSRGDSTFMLRYLAKQHLSPLPGQWKALNNNDRLPLEITPAWQGRQLILTVTWNGDAAAGLEVKVSGSGIEETLTTDGNGRVSIAPGSEGILSIRAKHVEDKSGEHNGQSYASVRTYSTLTLPVKEPAFELVDHSLPSLPRGITSFGSAIVGNDLYVYGGHFGQAHHYSEAGQSDEFRKISLDSLNPEWQLLPHGPKLTGLALVAHDGKLYRVGGFTATNAEGEDQSLWSQDSFACFDPATNQWSVLPPLPEGRSSHDAAVLDGKLYVVGGWKLAGGGETQWHKTAWYCDLTQSDLVWTAISAPPFQRRAVSIAAFNGQLFVIGGMQPVGGATTEVAVFDPATNAWTDGPALIGSGMEGFGSSAFAVGDTLVVTTMSGAAQGLKRNGTQWTVIGQLESPRFFHRQLTTGDGRLLVVGGASMQTGKTDSIELLQMAQ
jgi:N-acetylneuraminic acid mutarotase